MKNIGIFDLLYILAKRKNFVLIFTLICAIAAIAYAMLVSKYWISRAVIVPVQEENALGALDSGMMGLIGSSLLGGQKDSAVEFVSIMQSRSFREKVVNKFGLIPYFKLEDKPPEVAMELAVFKLAHNIMRITSDIESDLITVRVETKDRLLSKNIAQYYLDELQDYLRTKRGSKSKLQRQFLEGQVGSTKADIESLAVALRDFQTRNRAIGMDEQTAAMIDLYSQNIAELYKADIEHEVAKNQYGADSPVLKELAKRREVVAAKVKELENSKTKLVPGYMLQIDRIPDLALQYAQLKLNLEIKQKVFEYLYPQYELARLDEARDMPSFDILDRPSLAGLRSKPRRAILVSVLTFTAFLLGCLLALVIENLKVTHRDKVDRIFAALRNKRPVQQQ